jgi:phage tail sheath protein FI
MSELVVGIQHIRDGIEIQPTINSDMSVVGIIGTAPGADAGLFPFNEPKFGTTDNTAFLAGLGTTGTIVDAIAGVAAQVSQGVKLVIVRIDPGADADATVAAIKGSSSAKTGVHAFTKAPQELGVTPRIILASGWTSQVENGVDAITIGGTGTGYEVGDAITASGGSGTGFAAVIASVSGTGHPLTVTITNGGKDYVSAPTLACAGGTGATFTATIAQLANAVCAELPAVLERLKAVAVVQGPTSSHQAWIDWRETMQSGRIIPGATNDVKVLNSVGAVVTKPADSYIAGLLVRRDQQFGGRPFHSAANQPIYGIVGVSRIVDFSLTDASTEGQDVAFRNGGFIVRGESGVESSLSEGGFVYWGTDTLSEDQAWIFYHVVRGRDFLELAHVRTLRFYLGRYNITMATIEAIIGTMDSQLSFAAAQGDILDYRLGFERDKNTPEELRKGNLWIKFQAEEPPVLRKIRISSQRYRAALESLAVNVSARLEALAI